MILLIDYNSFFFMEAAGVEPASEHIAIWISTLIGILFEVSLTKAPYSGVNMIS